MNQIEFDTASNCAFAKPGSVLNQQSSYLLLVTADVADANGHSVKADPGFEGCLHGGMGNSYCRSIAAAARNSGALEQSKIVGASLFTTLSATHWLEQVRKIVDSVPLLPNLPAGFPTDFPLKSVQSISWMPTLSGLPAQPIPLASLSGVDSIAFGFYLSPNYIALSGVAASTIPQTPTAFPAAPPNALLPVSYHVFLPSAKATGKIPVVIYGHGLSDNQFGAPTYIASKLAQNNFATLAIEIMGHGFGQGSYVTVTGASGQNSTVWTPGRGVLLPGNTLIGPTDGCIAPGAVAVRDCARQTAVDLFTLVNTIRSTNGLGLNLDPNRIYYVGQSFGSTYGTLFQATEPAVSTAVLNVGGGSSVDVARLAVSGVLLDEAYIASVNPAFLGNSPKVPYFDPFLDDSYPFRNQITTPVPGAIPIQAAFEAADWLGMAGDPLAFAAHLQSSSLLAGVLPKKTLFQFGYGDLEVPNPTESELVRTAGAIRATTFFHYDAAVTIDPSLLGLTESGLPILPHRILSNPTLPGSPAESSISYALQQQVADYFSSNGANITDPNSYLTGEFSSKHLFDRFTTESELPDGLDYPVAP